MRYAVSRFKKHQRDMAYRFYITDCVRIITQNTAMFSGGEYRTTRFIDEIMPADEDDRTGDEIAADIINRAGIEVI